MPAKDPLAQEFASAVDTLTRRNADLERIGAAGANWLLVVAAKARQVRV